MISLSFPPPTPLRTLLFATLLFAFSLFAHSSSPHFHHPLLFAFFTAVLELQHLNSEMTNRNTLQHTLQHTAPTSAPATFYLSPCYHLPQRQMVSEGLSCRSISAKEPFIIELFCEKSASKSLCYLVHLALMG